MKKLLGLFLFLNSPAWAGCLIQHVREGIELNEQRKAHYAIMTDDASIEVSNLLISYEFNVIALMKLTNFEKRYEALQKQGVPFLCEEFHSTVNPLSPVVQMSGPELKNFDPLSASATRKVLKAFLAKKDLSGFHKRATTLIDQLSVEPRFNCMTRHILESMGRVAWLAIQDLRRRDAALDLLSFMVWSLYGAKQLDIKAAPLQAVGVPILCHDLPMIEFR